MNKRIHAPALAAALFTLAASFTPVAAGAADESGGLTRTEHAVTGHAIGSDGKEVRSRDAQRQVVDFWTPDRMRQAKDLDVLEIDPSGRATAKPAAPQAKEPVSSQGLPATGLPGSGSDDASTAGAVFDADAPAVGKLFMQDPTTGTGYVCSGSVVGGNNGRTVLTAAHCLWDPVRQVRRTSVVFVPEYRNGAAPRGVWPMSDFIWPLEWHDHNQWHWDYAFFTVPKNASGYKIIDYTGYLGFTANILSNNFTDSMGYPAAAPFNGAQQKRDHAFAEIIDFVNTAPPELDGYFVRMDSAFTGGSSGGPWVDNYDVSTRLGAARGLNSFKFSGGAEMYSPYFDWDTWDMFVQAGNFTK